VRTLSLISVAVLSVACSPKPLKGGDGGDRNGGHDAASPRQVVFEVLPFTTATSTCCS
jgi:hypothetical protein